MKRVHQFFGWALLDELLLLLGADAKEAWLRRSYSAVHELDNTCILIHESILQL